MISVEKKQASRTSLKGGGVDGASYLPAATKREHKERRRVARLCGCEEEREIKEMAPCALLKKQVETLFWLICCKRKILFRLKKQAEKYGL